MRKVLSLAVVFLSLVGISAAQRSNHGNGRGGEIRRQDTRPIIHEQRSEPARHDRGFERDDRSFRQGDEREFHERNEFRGYHWGRGHQEIREHWDGRRFDHDYWERHWGERHRFYWNHCEWYGRPFYRGSFFWYNGVSFVIVDEVPYDWYGDPVYVVYDEWCGCYYVVDPLYPGTRIHVDIRF